VEEDEIWLFRQGHYWSEQVKSGVGIKGSTNPYTEYMEESCAHEQVS
jgi:hypothetical protein